MQATRRVLSLPHRRQDARHNNRVNFFSPGYLDFLPDWLRIILFFADLSIRVLSLFWLPYNRKPVVALGWLMAIFFIPFIGFLAFLIFGSSHLPQYRRARQHAMNDLIRETTGGTPQLTDSDGLNEATLVASQLNYKLGSLPLVGGNSFTLHNDNHEAMRIMAQEVDKAQRYVHFEFYITAYDEASKVLWDALFAAQKRGVRVRVLIDHIGSRKYPSYRQLTKMLNESGIEWRLMLPIKPWRLQWQRPDLRNHRKVLVIDGAVAFSGSQNAIHRSYDLKENVRKGLEWKDLTFSCTGPIVEELNAVFVSDWYSETNQLILEEIEAKIPYVPGSMRAQVVPSGPGFETENNLRLINYMIYNAEKRITICSPYFVPDETLLQALTNAAFSGIETTVIVCEKGDQFLPNMAQRSYYETLLQSGVRILQYPSPTVLHSKFMYVDDEMAFIGSSNMDPRSFSLNLEVSTFIADPAMVYALADVARTYESICTELRYGPWSSRPQRIKVTENICRLWSSLL